MTVIGNELGWDDAHELEELELEAEHDGPKPSTPTPGTTLGRTVRPRLGVKPLAARVPVTGPRLYLYL